ncbi:hypothetical protein ES703_88608 [subsurface metagenome]
MSDTELCKELLEAIQDERTAIDTYADIPRKLRRSKDKSGADFVERIILRDERHHEATFRALAKKHMCKLE